ncbi:MAG: FRG domain-containing protein [Chitinophagales bacterium]
MANNNIKSSKDNWQLARDAFFKFLEDVDQARWKLHCNISNAWFRGQEKDWPLEASLFRGNNSAITQVGLTASVEQFIDQIIRKKKEIVNLKKQIHQAFRMAQLNDGSEHIALSHQLGILKKEKAEIRRNLALTKNRLRKTEQEYVQKFSKEGESEAFVNWSRRGSSSSKNSWEILAEMQHYKVKTRLLDWTEDLSIALYFALKDHIDYYLTILNSAEHKREKNPFFLLENSEPCIYILNPYRLAHFATGQLRIFDPTLEELEYHESFLTKKNWPYRHPVPIYPPWRNPRITAQRGMFTVQGTLWEALDVQLANKTNDILAKIRLTPLAASYATRHILSFIDINRFDIYQDLDALGICINDEFLDKKRRH